MKTFNEIKEEIASLSEEDKADMLEHILDAYEKKPVKFGNLTVQFIKGQFDDYNEGNVTTLNVFKIDGLLVGMEKVSNSWEDFGGYDDEKSLDDLFEVGEVQITEFRARK